MGNIESFEAVQELNENVPITALWDEFFLVIPTLEGDHVATLGDYIIRGVHGELYPCKSDIFKETYEPAEDDER